MKKITLTVVLSILSFTILLAQTEEAFQNFLVKVQPVLTKNTEELTKEDVKLLNEAISVDPDTYGEANRRLCMKIKSDAAAKLDDYKNYLTKMQNMSKTLDELDEQVNLRLLTEKQRDSLAAENVKLLELIDKLNSQINSYKKQAAKLEKANKQMQKENLETKELLQNSSTLLAQMLMIMPDEAFNNELMQDVPKNIIDSLNQTQCAVAQLLKINFTTTLQSMRTDAAFMDSVAVFYKNNKKHDPQITNYIDATTELIVKLRTSGIECALTQASNIENELNEFLLEIEKRGDTIGSNFMNFITTNLPWLLIILLLLIAVTVLVVSKTKKNNT